MDLNSARIFANVAAKGSFSAAAEFMGIPVATVSRRVAELEASLNVRLLERSTRKLRLTEAGTTLYGFVTRGVEEMEAGLFALSEAEHHLNGRLRLSIPPNFEPLWQVLENFQQQHPNIDLELVVSERRLEFIEDGIDIALRVGALESELAVARLLTRYRHRLVASPEFLQTCTIKTPSDLHSKKCAAWAKQYQAITWQLGDQQLRISPFVRANDYGYMRYLALAGKCITELPPFFCQPYIERGELMEVLPNYPMPEQAIHLLYPSRKNVSRIMRAFIDFCVEHFKIQ